jgi:ribonuclease BN (tRNA processing enzyme)
MFKLRVVQAKFGDCLIVQYGTSKSPKFMLIDGGPGGVYPNFLKPELEKIAAAGGELELVVLSHIDGDHIVGLINLTEELKEQQADGSDSLIKIHGLWMNSFESSIGKNNQLTQSIQTLFSRVQNIQSTMPQGELAVLSIPQGNTLRRNAMLLEIPVNEIVNTEVISCDTLPDPLKLDNISITIIGPNEKNIKKLEEEWKKWIQKNEAKIMLSDPEVLANADQSVPNLSSIMFMMESKGKRILFTGDGRGDFILEGLEKQGFLDEEGKVHIDVFKAPHHGSIRNAAEEFFHRVTADIYVISANGHHHNPDGDTLQWIVESADRREEKVTILCTNETDATKKLLLDFPPMDHHYELVYFETGNNFYDIELV